MTTTGKPSPTGTLEPHIVNHRADEITSRSTGAGALAIWTHHLKDIAFIDDWSDDTYNGTAATLGSGVQGFEIMAAARDRGLVVVGGECATVGIAGGYAQGGGHSAISTTHGLAVDNVLQWEVVTADGSLLTANSKENTDLYWALKGGGGGNFGVVTSMTVKTYPDAITSGASLTFYATKDTQAFYGAIQKFHELLPAMVNAGTVVIYYFTDTYFQIAPFNAFNKTRAEAETILSPFTTALDSMGINYTASYTEYSTYYDHFNEYFGPLPQGNIPIGEQLHSARFIPRSVAANISTTWQAMVEKDVMWIGVGLDVSAFGSAATTSVHPGWRNALIHASITLPWNFTAPWEDMLARADTLTYEIMPMIEAVTPGAGAYLNEGDFQQPGFQDVFWGEANYAKLLEIKKKYDPDSFFYARIAVGSETWTVADDGRMCKTS